MLKLLIFLVVQLMVDISKIGWRYFLEVEKTMGLEWGLEDLKLGHVGTVSSDVIQG